MVSEKKRSHGFALIVVLFAIGIGLVLAGGVGFWSISRNLSQQTTATDSGNTGVSSEKELHSQTLSQNATSTAAVSGSGASVSVTSVFTQSVAVEYNNVPTQASVQVVSASGERFDAGSYADTLISKGTGSLTVALDECTPAGEYYVRVVERIPQKISGNEIPYSILGPTLAQSAAFHYGGTPQQSACDSAAKSQLGSSPAGTTGANAPQHVVPIPTCTLSLDKPSYQYGEAIILSWTSKNATYVAFDAGGSSSALNLPSTKLGVSGSITVRPSAGAEIALLRAYSDTGEGYCVVYPQVRY